MPSPVRTLLCGVPMLREPLPSFDPSAAPGEPFPLFLKWLAGAVRCGVSEPHAMALATVDREGRPDLRIVALRDATADGWAFATDADSPKSRQLTDCPQAALGFHWREQGRQIRLRGPVVRADEATAAEDFRSRLPGSRAATLVGRQSEPLADRAELAGAYAEALARVTADPDLTTPVHALFLLRPATVEFWQGAPGRGHVRLRYTAAATGWTRDQLWP
ncbi:pyridoxine/pyridoxamine 5'-phosphate oxidase [Streptacidiphilus carbonis]|uniref:pyridoxine/pyridoxamine 5'-phosphate oxidase n=1 Tax=Streptacidiphilus carbonis TaxID=105422 RepID=UPI0005A70970|nr:pyridoxal 5'-phosphate synthase [Streptacidiphilus carbonis]